ncbi:MAG TPA: outer membrane beta-barrel protein [Polyangiaceae bacterium]|nr:outer membrane beta-barrel protein [Polyangiaceae bacterium]
MIRRRTVVSHVLALGFSLSGQAFSQQPQPPAPGAAAKPAPQPPKPEVPPAAPPVVVAPTPAPAPPPADVAPAPAPTPPPAPAPAPLPLEPAPAPPADAAPPPADPEPDLPPPASNDESDDSYSWYDAIEFSAFADGYASVNYNFPKPQSGRNVLRAHDTTNGFALAWVGVNASYPADPVGATVSLRFGPTAREIGNCFNDDKSTCDANNGLQNVKQAFASWKPGGADSFFQLDLGKFETPYGAEVSESHLNMNYTRSMLYASQPVTHTGLRATFAVAEAFDFKLLAVNGWNNSIDNNVGKSLGAQAVFHLKGHDDNELLTAALGYLGGPEHDDTALVAGTTDQYADRGNSNTKGLRHLVDLVVNANPIERLRLVLNADYGLDHKRNDSDPAKFDSASYYGVLLGARVAIVDEFGVAARGEYFHDEAGALTNYSQYSINYVGGTLTLDYLPSDFLTIRLDGRYDWASRQVFNKDLSDTTGSQFTTTLGVVAHTN